MREEARREVSCRCCGVAAMPRRTAGDHVRLDELAYLVGAQAIAVPISVFDFEQAWLLPTGLANP